jgi:hypothetical protein
VRHAHANAHRRAARIPAPRRRNGQAAHPAPDADADPHRDARSIVHADENALSDGHAHGNAHRNPNA